MPQIIIGPNQTKKVDGSVRRAAYAFLEKLAQNDALPGLHIEPIIGSADPRVRTGRVNDFYRAVLFKVQGHADEAHYVYLGILPHDEAIEFAKTARLKVNPVNGIAELVKATEPAAAPPVSQAPVPEAVVRHEPEPAAAPDTAGPVPDVSAAAEPLLPAHGLTKEVLLDLGIDADLAERALAVTSDDELITAVESAPQWQALALIDLAGGKPVEDVRSDLGIGKVEMVGEEETDEELLQALQHDAAKLQFAFIDDDEELRKAIEDDDFAAWRVFLHPEQRRYATRSYNGAFRLSGGAGTGKTVVLLHRARVLARRNPNARILLTTYNTVLADALKTDLRRLDASIPIAPRLGAPGVYIAGVDSAVHSVVRSAGHRISDAITEVLGSRSPSIGTRTLDTAGRAAQHHVLPGRVLDGGPAGANHRPQRIPAGPPAGQGSVAGPAQATARVAGDRGLPRPRECRGQHRLQRGGGSRRRPPGASRWWRGRPRPRRRGAGPRAQQVAVPARPGPRGAGRPVHRRGLTPADLRPAGGARAVRHPDRRSRTQAHPQLPDDGGEPAVRDGRAGRWRLRGHGG